MLLYVSSCYYICVLKLLCMSPHATICVLILVHMCPHTAIYVCSYYYICVLILGGRITLDKLSSYCYMCPHATTHVSSCYNMCAHATIFNLSTKVFTISCVKALLRLF